MRIRKHAARILSALSAPAQPRAPAAAPEAPAAPAGRELEMHVCELNQSPWDAMAFSPPRGEDLYDYQELEDMEEELNGLLAEATLSAQAVEEELAAVVSDASGCPTFIPAAQSSWRRQPKIEEMVEGAEEEEKRVRKIEAAKKRSSSQGTKRNKRKMASSRERVGAEQDKVKMELESGIAVTTCKKSDGKGWHCKRAAQRPHSLCEYHLTQVRSYYSNGSGSNHALQQHLQPPRKTHGGGIDAKQNAVFIPDKKKNTKKKATTAKKDDGSKGDIGDGGDGRARKKPTSDFYYYYSGFGPWRRGKRRSGGGEQEGGHVDAINSDDEGDGGAPRDGAPSRMPHDQGPDDLDDDDEDIDGGDHEAGGCDGGDEVPAGRRRGRKPIKARSLKSLL
ncbi:hypothetical protein Taro_009867 [Colocasia esculenta]|uniref:WRC domain-containing protein n=1 Tax=Colocasia esculenta TaxID=4460 RepID=A0A843U1N4_COLES|nr:hypothetical protein [Colocasia esculenta]